ncbi:MAG: diaminopimelate epimerase [Vampirovibrionales bacterium]|nr:diaminopimelate epimerase [Vampirovibrionales bacterium]
MQALNKLDSRSQQSNASADGLALPFVKMHGLGNDFVMLKSADLPVGVNLEKLAARLCDRHFGIGADGLILDGVATSANQDFDIRFVYLNGDGSWAEMCGNGIRCFARFVYDAGIVQKTQFKAETLAGPIQPRLNPDQSVTVDMGAPILQASDIPFKAEGVSPGAIVENQVLSVLGKQVPISAVSMGNPHCLIFQQDLGQPLAPDVFGPALETHPAFPNKTNVEFLEVIDEHTLRCIVWERGCGFTLACGTGACAAAVSAIRLGKVKSPVTVHLPGGPLTIEWAGSTHPVMMTGPATYAFSGVIILDLEQLK